MNARPGGPTAKRKPSPEGLGIYSEDDLSAVGAALNLGPLAPVTLGYVTFNFSCEVFEFKRNCDLDFSVEFPVGCDFLLNLP